MSFKKQINQFRRTMMRSLTKNVGASQGGKLAGETVFVKSILICRPNHRLGNLILITPLVKELEQTFPGCKIDLFVKGGLGPIVFRNYPVIREIIALPKKPAKELSKYIGKWIALKKTPYDLVINVIGNSSSGRLSAKFSNARYKFYGDDDENIQASYADGKHLAKYPVYYLRRFLTTLGITERAAPVPTMDLKLDPEELAIGKKILDDLVKNTKPTIAIYTFATGDKCYSKEWWDTLYNRLLKVFPTHNVVEVLPVENVSQINFKAPSYYSKDVREIGAFIRNTAVFVGADSGIMHLASAALAPTVGLFSITNPELYQPYNDGSVGVNTTTSDINDWLRVISGIVSR